MALGAVGAISTLGAAITTLALEATVDAVDAVAYFPSSSVIRPLLVLAIWLVAAAAVLLAARSVRARFGLDVVGDPGRAGHPPAPTRPGRPRRPAW